MSRNAARSNSNSGSSSSGASGWLDRALEQRVLATLSRWQHGRLSVRPPSGEFHYFGDPSADAPTVELLVHDPRFYRRIALEPHVGIGESYAAGEWSSPDLPRLIAGMLRNRPHLEADGWLTRPARLVNRALQFARRNTRSGSQRNIHEHYDLGNEFFKLFLDPTLAYSSAVFPEPTSSLEVAQIEKFRLIVEKLKLRPDDHLLEIGTGWGGFAIYAAQQTGCRVTSITISREQQALACQRVREAGLEDRIDVRYCDYRDIDGHFDKVVSIEMLEAVGAEYWDGFFAKIDQVMAPDGLALIQVICVQDQNFESYKKGTDWVRKYIFPGGLLPSLFELQRSVRRATSLELHEVGEIGAHYARTLRVWRERFWKNSDAVTQLGFDERFKRIWDFYLASCEATLGVHWTRDLQIVLTRPMNPHLADSSL